MLSNRRSTKHDDDMDEEKSLPSSLTLDDGKKALPWRFAGQQLLAVTLATVCSLVDAFASGLILFPRYQQDHLGICMVMMSTAVSQLVFAVLQPDVPLVSLFIVENIPMLHAMASSAAHHLKAERPQAVIPTTLALYTAATLLTAMAFLLCGYFKMARVFKSLPKPVLMGCLGGMGIYFVFYGLGTSTGIDWSWTLASFRDQLRHWQQLLVTVVLESLLLYFLERAKKKDLVGVVLPSFFLAVMAGSWVILAVSGRSLEEAQNSGWFFQKIPSNEPYFTFEYIKSVDLVAWNVFPDQLPLFIGIMLFSCLHVPVNVPALAAVTKGKQDIDASLMAHGVANLLSACFGSLQTYMTFSSSFLYYKCGGRGQVSSILLALLLLWCIPWIPSIIIRLPRVVAGCLMMHIGVELFFESVVDTLPGLDWLECIMLVAIALMCNVDFVSGFLLGLFCACMAFVAQTSMSEPVQLTFYPGKGLRSRVLRSKTETQILEDYDRSAGFLILRLQGVLFFGNAHSLLEHVENVRCSAVIIDFAQVTSMDSTSFVELEMAAKMLQQQQVTLICSGLRDLCKVKRSPELLTHAIFVKTMEEGVTQLEQSALSEAGDSPTSVSSHRARERTASAHAASTAMVQAVATGEEVEFFQEAWKEILDALQLPMATAEGLQKFFQFQRAKKGTVLWTVGDESDFAFLLVSGHIGVVDDFCRLGDAESEFVETCVRGHWVGELNLFTGESRKNKLLATEDLSMWTITKTSLDSMQQNAINLAFAFQSLALRFAAHRMYLSMLEGHVHSI